MRFMVNPESSWIWQAPTWPHLEDDRKDLISAIATARREQRRLRGKAQAVGATNLTVAERDVWSDAAVATAAIEGEKLDLAAVRSSVARRLGINSGFIAAVPRNVEGLLDVMEDAAANWHSDLTDQRIC